MFCTKFLSLESCITEIKQRTDSSGFTNNLSIKPDSSRREEVDPRLAAEMSWAHTTSARMGCSASGHTGTTFLLIHPSIQGNCTVSTHSQVRRDKAQPTSHCNHSLLPTKVPMVGNTTNMHRCSFMTPLRNKLLHLVKRKR